jgi:hypothetical protein
MNSFFERPVPDTNDGISDYAFKKLARPELQAAGELEGLNEPSKRHLRNSVAPWM